MKTNLNLTLRSLNGLWVGDCIGNVGQLYFAHDILKALDEGLAKFGNGINPHGQHFALSDDTEEAIVLVNHLNDNGQILQDKYAYELSKRYFERDPDGEHYGYGLMTRSVLRDIYFGKDWRVANQTKPRVEGPSFVDKLIVGVAGGKSITAAMAETNADLQKELANKPELKIGSCGNGSAMRVAPLGAFVYENYNNLDDPIGRLIEEATLQAQVTHCHPEGIAGSIAVSILSYYLSSLSTDDIEDLFLDLGTQPQKIYDYILSYVPSGKVYDGIVRASELPFDLPLMKVIEILGNGTHVTCQDTVPLCVYLVIRGLFTSKLENYYENTLIETCKCFGDVDTNCAIVGGLVGIINPPPAKWVSYCQPMEGVLGAQLPEHKPLFAEKRMFDKMAIKAAMAETQIDPGITKEVDEVTEMDYSNPDLKKPVDFMEFIKTRNKTL
jgi:ADP-ribosylglycohydrolase